MRGAAGGLVPDHLTLKNLLSLPRVRAASDAQLARQLLNLREQETISASSGAFGVQAPLVHIAPDRARRPTQDLRRPDEPDALLPDLPGVHTEYSTGHRVRRLHKRLNSPELLSSQDLIPPSLDRYLRQGPRCGPGLYRRASGGVEDRAVAWAGKLAVPIVHRAAPVCADRRVRCKVAIFEMHHHRRRGLKYLRRPCTVPHRF